MSLLSALCGSGLSQMYRVVQAARGVCYDQRLIKPAIASLPVVSIGGLEVGGVGKTPIVGLLLDAMLRAGLTPGLLTRGFRRRRRGLVVRPRGHPATVEALGDEASMLMAQGLDVPVAAVNRRQRGAAALSALGADVVVMDDGFAHRALARDLDIVVLQGEAPLGDRHLLPRGCLREMPAALGRADLLWYHFRAAPADGQRRAAARAALPQAIGGKPCLISEAWPAPATGFDGKLVRLAGRAVMGVAAIARPLEFERSLMARGAQLVAFLPLPDHHRFSAAEAIHLQHVAHTQGAALVCVTPKDFVKLAPLWPKEGLPLCQAGVRVDLIEGHEVLEEALGRLCQAQVRLPRPPQPSLA